MAIVLLNFNQIYVVQGPQNKYKIQNIYLFTFLYKMNYLYFNYYVQNELPIFNTTPVFIYYLHHVHRKSFKCRELSSKKSLYSILIINHLCSSLALHVFWIKMEKSFKGEGISNKLSTFLSYGKKNVIGYKTKTVNEKEVVVEIWFKVCPKHKNKLKELC